MNFKFKLDTPFICKSGADERFSKIAFTLPTRSLHYYEKASSGGNVMNGGNVGVFIVTCDYKSDSRDEKGIKKDEKRFGEFVRDYFTAHGFPCKMIKD